MGTFDLAGCVDDDRERFLVPSRSIGARDEMHCAARVGHALGERAHELGGRALVSNSTYGPGGGLGVVLPFRGGRRCFCELFGARGAALSCRTDNAVARALAP
jgi:hypothetical protein